MHCFFRCFVMPMFQSEETEMDLTAMRSILNMMNVTVQLICKITKSW